MAFDDQLKFRDPRIFAGLNYRQGESWPYSVRITDSNKRPVNFMAEDNEWTFTAPVEYYDSKTRGGGVALTTRRSDVVHAPLDVIGTRDQKREGWVQVVIPSDLWTGEIPLNTSTPPVATVWVTATENRVDSNRQAIDPFIRKIGIGIAIRRAI